MSGESMLTEKSKLTMISGAIGRMIKTSKAIKEQQMSNRAESVGYDAKTPLRDTAAANSALQAHWHITHVIDYGSQAAIHGLPQFGFHDHTGALYKLEYHKNFIGLLSSTSFVWTAGENDPLLAPVHYTLRLDHPKYLARAFHHDTLLISEEKYIYQMDLSTNRFLPLIDKEKAGIVDIGNCVYDHQDTIWVNDIRGFRIFHFEYDGTLIETIGSGAAGFQRDTVPFEQARFHWMYDLRLGPDGNLYVLDSRNFAVRKIDIEARTVSTLCGDGVGGYLGDGGNAKNARLGSDAQEFFDGPWSLFVDEQSNIIIGDTQNHAIRCIHAGTNTITTISSTQDTAPDGSPMRFDKICGMDYWNGTLYIPDWRSDAPNTGIILQRQVK